MPQDTETRLYWLGMRGIAASNGRQVKLTAPPHLPRLQIDAIDWAPELRVAMVMPRRGVWRDMTGDEIEAARGVLEQMVQERAHS